MFFYIYYLFIYFIFNLLIESYFILGVLWFQICKAEFIQSFCWLSSMRNLLVIQYLENLYLDGNHVRVVCEEKLKSVYLRRASQLDLATSSRVASRQRWHTCEACRGAEGSCQL